MESFSKLFFITIIALYLIQLTLASFNAVKKSEKNGKSTLHRLFFGVEAFTKTWTRIGVGILVPALVTWFAAFSTEFGVRHAPQSTPFVPPVVISSADANQTGARQEGASMEAVYFAGFLSMLVVTMTLGFVTLLEENWTDGRWKGLTILSVLLDVLALLTVAGISASEHRSQQIGMVTVLTFCAFFSSGLVSLFAREADKQARIASSNTARSEED